MKAPGARKLRLAPVWGERLRGAYNECAAPEARSTDHKAWPGTGNPDGSGCPTSIQSLELSGAKSSSPISDCANRATTLSLPVSMFCTWTVPARDHAIKAPSTENVTTSARLSTGRQRRPVPSDCMTQTVLAESKDETGIVVMKRIRRPSGVML